MTALVRIYEVKSMRIVFATGNAGKMREIRDILADVDAEVYSLKDLGLKSAAEETGETFGENAEIKIREIYDILKEKGEIYHRCLRHRQEPCHMGSRESWIDSSFTRRTKCTHRQR